MPRSPRVEYEGARYHVLNRGNYRRDLFKVYRTGEEFREKLYETCERYNWVLHGYVVMSNHYHLALETPKGNLSAGMHYLQSVFSNRFNKFVKDRGHVFQGRYKALVLEDSTALLQVVDYIHLNPVRAGTVKLENLRSYRLSSFGEFFQKKRRPRFLIPAEFLNECGGLTDTAAGMRAYHRRLKLLMEEDPKKREEEFERLCRGWYIGSQEGKAWLAGRIQDGKVKANAEATKELEEVEWTRQLKRGLKRLGKVESDCRSDRKNAEWKVALGAWLKGRTGVGNLWLSQRINLGHPHNASKQMALYRKKRMETCPYAKRLKQIPKE